MLETMTPRAGPSSGHSQAWWEPLSCGALHLQPKTARSAGWRGPDGACLAGRRCGTGLARHRGSCCSPRTGRVKASAVCAVSVMVVGKLRLREMGENEHQALGLKHAFLRLYFYSGKPRLKISVEQCYFFPAVVVSSFV